MRAISKFKNLLNRNGAARKSQQAQPGQNEPDTDLSNTNCKEPTQNDKESTAEFAQRILEERRKFFNPSGPRALGGRYNLLGGGPLHPLATENAPPSSTSSSSTTTLTNSMTISAGPGPGTSDQNQQQQQQQNKPPPHLGIGTGGVDDFAINPSDLPPADHVSESPTMTDINIYDNAFEAEIERIKRSASISSASGRRNSNAQGRRGTATTGTIYHTRLNRKRHDTTILENDGLREVDEDRGGLFGTRSANVTGKVEEKGAAAATPRGLWQPRGEGGSDGKKAGGGGFASVVARAMEGAKEMVVGGSSTDEKREGGGQ